MPNAEQMRRRFTRFRRQAPAMCQRLDLNPTSLIFVHYAALVSGGSSSLRSQTTVVDNAHKAVEPHRPPLTVGDARREEVLGTSALRRSRVDNPSRWSDLPTSLFGMRGKFEGCSEQ